MTELDRLKRAIEAIVRKITRRIDFLALYPAKVLKDYGSNQLDVEPDDQRLPKMVKIPIALFIPGATVEVNAGARVLVGFDGGDPSKPRAYLWQEGSLKTLKIVASTKVVVDAPAVELGGEGGMGVARIGDTVVAGGLSGTITGGSSKVKAS